MMERLFISIHAPAKGATNLDNGCSHCTSISIHAPAKGATNILPSRFHSQIFQSTLPRRERQKYIDCKLLSDDISIHAPAKGATLIATLYHLVFLFQSTLPRRERQHTLIEMSSVFLFQSTLPRRERRGVKIDISSYTNFNPRSREGSDWIAPCKL